MYNKDYKFNQEEYNDTIRKQSEAIKSIREYYELSKPEMAQLLGISERHYFGLESGQNSPSCKTIFIMAKVFNVSIDGIIYGSNSIDSTNTLKRTIINGTNELSICGQMLLLGNLKNIKEIEDNYPEFKNIVNDYFQQSQERPHD